MQMTVIDANGEWWINTAAFRMVDPTRLINAKAEDEPGNHENFAFEPGIKYQIRPTDWMQNQPVMLKTTPTDEEVLALVQRPETNEPMIAPLEAYREAHGQELAKVDATPEAVEAAEKAVEAQFKPAKAPKAAADTAKK